MNFKLFKNTFKQMAKIGISCGVLFVLCVVLPVISEASLMSQNINESIVVISYAGQHRFLYLFFVVLAPVLSLVGWNFLNKRNSCDFYHALPYTRKTLYVSKLAAIIAWQTIIMLVTMTASFAVYGIFSKYFVVDYVFAMKFYLSLWVSSMLCISAVTLGCMLTGTTINNILSTGIILFFVRIMLVIFTVVATCDIQTVMEDKVAPLLDYSYNMVFGTVAWVFLRSGTSLYEMYNNVGSYVYTMGLALIYFVIAGILCVKRKSETAGKTALNEKVSFIMKTIMVFFFFAMGTVTVVSEYLSEGRISASVAVDFIIWAIVGIVFILGYQLYNTRSFATLKKCIFPIITAFVLCIVFALGIGVTNHNIKNYSPQPDKVEYISIYNGDYDDSYADYFASGMTRFEIKNQAAIEKVCEKIKENNQYLGKGFWRYINKNDYTCLGVKIKDNSGIHYRYVYMSYGDLNCIATSMGENEDIKQFYLNLPNPSAKLISTQRTVSYAENKEYDNLYEHIRQYVATMDFAEWYELISNYNYYDSISVSFSENGRRYRMEIPIPDDGKIKAEYYNILKSGKGKTYAETIGTYIKELFDENADASKYAHIGIECRSGDISGDELMKTDEGKKLMEAVMKSLLADSEYEDEKGAISYTISLDGKSEYCSVTVPVKVDYQIK